jgi:hypothetical protein
MMTPTLEQTKSNDSPITKPAAPATRAPNYWETLCIWLTNELYGVSASVERRERNCSRLESHFHPLERFTTRVTSNGVRVIAIGVRTNGHTRVFEVAGPNSVTFRWNSAGRPKAVEIRNEEGVIILHFCGAVPAAPASSANAWGE